MRSYTPTSDDTVTHEEGVMYANSPDQSLLWWAVQRGWGAERFDPETTKASQLATPVGGPSRWLKGTARPAHRRAAHRQLLAG